MKRRLCVSALALLWTLLLALEGAAESFLVLSDTHLNAKKEDPAFMREAVISAARECGAVLMLGDSTDNGRGDDHAMVLSWAQEIRDQTGAQVYILPGNHDYHAGLGPKEFSRMYGDLGWDRAFSRDTDSASYAVWTDGDVCLIMLDTNRFDQTGSVLPDGAIGRDTLLWTQETLASLPDGTPVIVCGHHPILPREREGRTPGAYALSQLLRAYGAGLYLCGHDHGFATTEQQGLRQITVGQPQTYPGWAGKLEADSGQLTWHTLELYDKKSADLSRLREDALSLGRQMARGALEGTQYADDLAAAKWFVSAYMLLLDGELTPERSAALLSNSNCRKWRRAETRTVVKDWIMGVLANVPEDVRSISVPPSRKHPPKLPEEVR